MIGIIAYFLLYTSTAFYCGFNSAAKGRLADYAKDTEFPITFFLNEAKADAEFNYNCEAFDCLTTNLKLFNEKAEVIKEGWISAITTLSQDNTTMINIFKKKLNKCVPEVNQKLPSYALETCNKYRIGIQLLKECTDKIKWE